jgi:hypothetical protein
MLTIKKKHTIGLDSIINMSLSTTNKQIIIFYVDPLHCNVKRRTEWTEGYCIRHRRLLSERVRASQSCVGDSTSSVAVRHFYGNKPKL